MIKHRHHIIPRHAGGTDDLDNIRILSVAEHAEAHRILYETHGRWQDRLAWRALSGMIDKDEVLSEIYIENSKVLKEWMQNNPHPFLGRTHSMDTRQKIARAKTGIPRSKESCLKQSQTMSGSNNHFYGKTHTEEFKKAHSERQKVRYSGAGSNTAIKVEVIDNEGVRVFGCIKDYAVLKGIKPIKVQHFYRQFKKNSSYRPRDGHPISCIISIREVL